MYIASVSPLGFLAGYTVTVTNTVTGNSREIAFGLGMWEAINLKEKFNLR